VLPKIIENLRGRKIRYAGYGDRALNTIYIGNLVEAALLAMEKGGVGQIYNLTDGERVSKQRFIDGVADGMGLPRPTALVPPWLARILTPLWAARIMATVQENRARRCGATKAPELTQAKVKFIVLNLDFSIEKAKRELGYAPRFSFEQGLAETIAWYKRPGGELPGANRGDRIIAAAEG
jgi:nucleoside-diphosphate-sugar epimerase